MLVDIYGTIRNKEKERRKRSGKGSGKRKNMLELMIYEIWYDMNIYNNK